MVLPLLAPCEENCPGNKGRNPKAPGAKGFSGFVWVFGRLVNKVLNPKAPMARGEEGDWASLGIRVNSAVRLVLVCCACAGTDGIITTAIIASKAIMATIHG